MVYGIVLSASRTGVVGVLLLAAWGAWDLRLTLASRRLLLLSPIFYALTWIGLAAWAHVEQQAFGGMDRLAAEAPLSSSRFAIWANTWR